jgi:hypothetical protein
MKILGYVHGIKWTDEKIEKEIKRVMYALHINRMPSRSEIEEVLKDSALTNKIGKLGGFQYWANKLGLETKESETSTGKEFEEKAIGILESRGYRVQRMTTKYPYDLLVNEHIKVEVKVGRPYMLKGESRVHTFRTSKRHATCDLYLIFALDESEEVERLFIIPGCELKIVTLCIGKNSKYNKYIDRWDLVDKFNEFYKGL